MAPDGELSVGAGFLENNQHYNLGFQALPWLETSFRYSGLQHFDPAYKVYFDRAFGLKMRRVGRTVRRERASAFLDAVGLSACAESYPHELSVGMRQRVNIARALLVEPHALLMDEPFASLDALTRLALREDLLRLWGDRRCSVLYVTHDIEEAVILGDRVLVMSHGGIREDLSIRIPRPRDLVGRHQADIQEWTWHIWTILESDVRQRLLLPR